MLRFEFGHRRLCGGLGPLSLGGCGLIVGLVGGKLCQPSRIGGSLLGACVQILEIKLFLVKGDRKIVLPLFAVINGFIELIAAAATYCVSGVGIATIGTIFCKNTQGTAIRRW